MTPPAPTPPASSGFIPTGWYPSALAIAPDGRTLYVGTGKGLSFRANDKPTTPWTRNQPVTNQAYDYIGGALSGAVCAVRLPDAKGLAAYTQQVYANTPGLAPPDGAILGPEQA